MTTQRITLDGPREDSSGVIHYFTNQAVHKRTAPCGTLRSETRRRAWFNVGDRRGGVFYVRACDTCREWLTF